MKRPFLSKLSVLAVSAALVTTAVALNDGDSLISLTYINNIFSNSIKSQTQSQTEGVLGAIYTEKLSELYQLENNAFSSQSTNQGLNLLPIEFQQNDIITISQGAVVVPSLGVATLSVQGTLIDLTTGTEQTSGSLITGRRYMVAENSAITLNVQSGIAKIAIQGGYTLYQTETISHDFADVVYSDWYNNAVTFVEKNNLFLGTGDYQFSPTEPMDRAMIVTVLYRLAGSPAHELATATATFTDVPDGEWYTDFVRWAGTYNITSGMGDGLFCPTVKVSQQQILVMLHAFARDYLKLNVTTTGDLSLYYDASMVDEWAVEATIWATEHKLLSGTLSGSTTLNPTANATRGFVAVVLMNFSNQFQ